MESQTLPRFMADGVKNITPSTAAGRIIIGVLALTITVIISTVMLLEVALPRAVRLALIPLWAIVMGHGISARTKVCFWMSLFGIRECAKEDASLADTSGRKTGGKSLRNLFRASSDLDITCSGAGEDDKEALITTPTAASATKDSDTCAVQMPTGGSASSEVCSTADNHLDSKRRLLLYRRINRDLLAHMIGVPAHYEKVQDPAIKSLQKRIAKRVASVILIASGISALLVSVVP